MKVCRKVSLLAVLVLLLSMTLALPASAAKPAKNSCGVLGITTSGEDMQYCMAVCVEEDGKQYVYSGNHPIQQQIALYVTFTNAMEVNSGYNIEEDTDYDAVQGVYRFALKEKVEAGASADVFPKMAAVSKKDTVYFVHLDINEIDWFVMEKTTVSSVRSGVITTTDGLEKDYGNGDFAVIFNDSGDVVGFCKSGVASAPASSNSGGVEILWIVAAIVAVAAGVILWLFNEFIYKNSLPNDKRFSLEIAIRHGGNGHKLTIQRRNKAAGRREPSYIQSRNVRQATP